MRIALTGASGFIGGFIASAARDAGHQVTPVGRANGWSLGDTPDLSGQDALIHCAFQHVPGRYRGGEGGDPHAFRRANLSGSLRLFEAAGLAGLRVLFLSSRAVLDGWPPGSHLGEAMQPCPTTLYGEVKALGEAGLHNLVAQGCAIRATGVYGPAPAGRDHKWAALFRDFLDGRVITPRVASEVHGADLAQAVLLLLATPELPRITHISDLVLDRHDLLARVARTTGHYPGPLPDRADRTGLKLLDCAALTRLGWRGGGWPRLDAALPGLIAQATRAGKLQARSLQRQSPGTGTS